MFKCLRRAFSSSSIWTKFDSVELLPIEDSFKQSLKSLGISKLTEIQSRVFSPIFAGQSLVAAAKTGQGKTLAYLVPILARLADNRVLGSDLSLSCLIAVPTRELCEQVAQVVVSIDPTVSIMLVYGKPERPYSASLQQHPRIIVGTVGRLKSLIDRRELKTDRVQICVLDESDLLLMRDYYKNVSRFLECLRASTQVVAVGATLTADLEKVFQSLPVLKDALRVNTVGPGALSPEKISHRMMKSCNSTNAKLSALSAYLSTKGFARILVFAASSAETRAIVNHPYFIEKARALHGQLPQSERQRILNIFRVGRFPILVLTDVGARGLDIPDVDLVVSFAPPADFLTYIHRSGRTGRAGKSGQSLIMYSKQDKPLIDSISSNAGIRFESEECPSSAAQRESMLENLIHESKHFPLSPESRLSTFLRTLSETEQRFLLGKCIQGLVVRSLDAPSASKSILSGDDSFTPVMFIEPTKQIVKSGADVRNILSGLGISTVGVIASCASGYIVDLLTPDAIAVCSDKTETLKNEFGIEAVLVDRLPKLLKTRTSRKTDHRSRVSRIRKNKVRDHSNT
jgi:ATP-dependent RNA helicase DDX21